MVVLNRQRLTTHSFGSGSLARERSVRTMRQTRNRIRGTADATAVTGNEAVSRHEGEVPLMSTTTGGVARDQAETGDSSFDRDYWLARCEGYKVESPILRELGVVEQIIPPSAGRPGLLAVRGGLFGRRLKLVPTNDVDVVVPRARSLFLRSARARRRGSA